ncbi:MAG: glycerol kinase [bacterium]|nr:glycerol kinase [bacterium]
MPASGPAVLALDVGTTGVRALVIDADGRIEAEAYRETLPAHPGPGLVEHDLDALWDGVTHVLGRAIAGVTPGRIRGVGLATQRSTAVVWETATQRPTHAAISWQDNRTVARCGELLAQGMLVTPLMAASKIEWLLDRADPDRSAVRAGRLRCGTLESWLAARLTRGAVVATDGSNASCSGLFDFIGGAWIDGILDALRIPLAAMPDVVDSSVALGPLDPALGLPGVPLAAIIGDQQAAMMGQLRLEPGTVKISYGTAAMLDLNAGERLLFSSRGAYPLVLWRRDGVVTYCLEGTAITAGAAVTWLRDGLGVIADPAETATLAASVPDAGGAWVVPAFQGLGTPHLDTTARAVVGGLSRATTKAHVVRALLEGIAWRCREVYDALRADCPFPPPETLRVDGGAARNDVLLQAQADALGIPVERAAVLDAAAMGAGYLAGLATGVWSDAADLAHAWRRDRIFEPRLAAAEREVRFAAWQQHLPAAKVPA